MRQPVARVAIVGAGMAGLSTAYYLLRDGRDEDLEIEVSVFEAADRTGGVVRTERDGPWLLDLGPDSLFTDKPAALELARELGLADELIAAHSDLGVSVLWKGKFHRIPEGLLLVAPTQPRPFMASKLFSAAGKARALAEPLVPRLPTEETDDVPEEESIGSFVRRRFGDEILERVAEPLMAGIHAGDVEKLSIQQTFRRLPALEQAHGSVLRGMLASKHRPASGGGGSGGKGNDADREGAGRVDSEPTRDLPEEIARARFLSFRGGMQTLTEAVATAIQAASPQTIRTSTPIRGLQVAEATGRDRQTTAPAAQGARNEGPQAGLRFQLDLADGSVSVADACVLALPAFHGAELVAPFDGELAATLREIPYVSTAAVYLGFPRDSSKDSLPLEGTGYLVPRASPRAAFGCTVVTRKFDHRADGDRTLLRFFFGGALQPEVLDVDDASLIAPARQEASELLGIDRQPEIARVQRWPRSNPQYEVGHAERVRTIDARLSELPGLFVAGSSCRGVGIPDAVASGRQVAAAILERIAGS